MKWIKVEDELPKEGIKVLCVYRPKQPIMEGTTVGLLVRINHVPSISSVRRNIDENGFMGVDVGQVTHWMYLPEKP